MTEVKVVTCPTCKGAGKLNSGSSDLKNRACKACYGFVEEFFLFDDVWALTGVGPNSGWLCLSCTGKKLGRQVSAEDLDPRRSLNRAMVALLGPYLQVIDNYRWGRGILRNARRSPKLDPAWEANMVKELEGWWAKLTPPEQEIISAEKWKAHPDQYDAKLRG